MNCLSKNIVDVPTSLVKAVSELKTESVKEAIYLVFHCIERTRKTKREFVAINDAHFVAACPTKTTKTEAKKWLQGKPNNFATNDTDTYHKFIEVIESERPNAQGKYGKNTRYKIVADCSERTVIKLTKRERNYLRLNGPIDPHKRLAKDPLLEATRKNLDLITLKENELLEFCSNLENTLPIMRKKEYTAEGIAKHRKIIIDAAFVLKHKFGRVKRGRKMRRIFSPWTNTTREMRKFFLFDNQEIYTLDLGSSQPTLLAAISGDNKMLEACFNDEIYKHVQALLGINRTLAKKVFLAYMLGPNRTENSRNSEAYKISKWIEKEFPVAFAYCHREKDHQLHGADKRHYQNLAVKMQNLESDIFVEDIFRQLTEENIPALTLHDGIAFPKEHFASVAVHFFAGVAKVVPSYKFKVSHQNTTRNTENYMWIAP